MKKRSIAGFVSGAVAFGAVGAIAANLTAASNPFPITLNGENVILEGYNIWNCQESCSLKNTQNSLSIIVQFADCNRCNCSSHIFGILSSSP